MNETELETLLCAGLDGDGAAYRRFLAGLAPCLRAMALATLPAAQRDMAEDVVQEVLLVVHLKRASWDRSRPLMAWLRVILRHKAIDALRRLPRAPHHPVEPLADSLPAASPDPLAPHLLGQMLDRLTPRDAALIRAHALEDADPAEMARRFDITPGALRVALHRALGRLAEIARKDTR
ncbi:sigma-70 family RNA polymerase sigma factor [Paracoccus jiaweipingae]|uniref:sigma-70 family RNA polymerase sigma factor n=1 Tax=unclassified Paracoccus (in: a-proteobacteria) TaxID=2688777 RepID=UPI0037B08497